MKRRFNCLWDGIKHDEFQMYAKKSPLICNRKKVGLKVFSRFRDIFEVLVWDLFFMGLPNCNNSLIK